VSNALIRYLIEPTPVIRAEDFRTYVLFGVGSACGVVVHLTLLALFAGYGVHEMVLVNLLSLPLYGLGFWCNRTGRHIWTAAIAVLELSAHQLLAVHYIGWESGIQYYLLLIPPIVFSLSGDRRLLKTGLVTVAIGTFLVLMMVMRKGTPQYALPVTMLAILNVVNITAVFGLLAFLTYNYARAAEVAEGRLNDEYRRAESLLHNILPVPIAARLKATKGVIADGFEDASVLFADLVGFTGLSERTTPQALVALLNDIFSAFDDAVEARGLEKIKTIGDSYMVVAGIPEPRADHADALADLAFELVDIIKEKAVTLDVPLVMRVGINSGPVVAGVIGKRKFIYDLWGDAVNTAARMESHGVPGRIQVTEATRDRLGPEYRCEARGEIAIKGKGLMPVFLLTK
jgi:adenylate cyclase